LQNSTPDKLNSNRRYRSGEQLESGLSGKVETAEEVGDGNSDGLIGDARA
jgi:hypothetical protein